MINNEIILSVFGAWMDDNYPEHSFTPKILDEFLNFMKKDLYTKMEIIIYKDDKKIIYDDLSGIITYFNNCGDCIEVNIPITASVNDIYKKMELICIELNLPNKL